MHILFPENANPLIEERFIEVGEPLAKGPVAGQRHSVRVGCYGNPNGIPVVVVHGGPGSGCSDVYTRVFPENKFYIIMIDQRGAGRSTPSAFDCLSATGELEGNNTDALLEDMEVIRKIFLGDAGTWHVFGGSWGATIALLYAERYPTAVDTLILRGVWIAPPNDICRIFEDSDANFLKLMRPEVWDIFDAPFKKIQQSETLKHHYNKDDPDGLSNVKCCLSLLPDPSVDVAIKEDIMKMWSAWEYWLSSSSYDVGRAAYDEVLALGKEDMQRIFSSCAIQVYYYVHDCFVQPNQILKNIAALKNIKAVYIVQGSNDFVCPEGLGAYPIKQALEAMSVPVHYDLRDQTGHGFDEPGIVDGLIRVTMAVAES